MLVGLPAECWSDSNRNRGRFHAGIMVGFIRNLQQVGMDRILAIIQPNVEKTLEPAVIENTQRKDLNPLDEAEAFQSMIFSEGYSLKELSQKVDRSVSLLSETLQMNKIPFDVRDECRHYGHLTSSGHCIFCYRLLPPPVSV